MCAFLIAEKGWKYGKRNQVLKQTGANSKNTPNFIQYTPTSIKESNFSLENRRMRMTRNSCNPDLLVYILSMSLIRPNIYMKVCEIKMSARFSLSDFFIPEACVTTFVNNDFWLKKSLLQTDFQILNLCKQQRGNEQWGKK